MKFEIFIYEQIRSNKEGGGVALCALKELNPAYVCDGGDEVEAITVDIHLKTMSISVTSAYGPQNSAPGTKKEAFWTYLTDQASRAKETGKGFILQGDLNAWLGSELLPGDKKPQNSNGKMLQNFMKENNLICVNCLPFSKGLVTRTRKYLGEVKQSTIDFYVVCQSVLPHISSMEIIDCTEHNLTNYTVMNKGESAVTSDHAPTQMEVKLEANPIRKQKKEIFNH